MSPRLIEAPSVLRGDVKRRGWFVLAGWCVAAAAIAAVTAMVVVKMVPQFSENPSAAPEVEAAAAPAPLPSLKAQLFPAPQRRPAGTLVVHDSSGVVDDPLPLGASVSATEPDAFVTISGMPPGARLTVGRRTDAKEWRASAQDIAGAAIIPPSGFVGAMDLSVELRGGDSAALVRSFVRLSWQRDAPGAAPAPVLAPVAAAAPQASPPASSPDPAIDPRETAALLSRAQQMLAGGDLQSARLLLMRAVKSRDGRAALALAKTYDPIELKQLGATGPQPDVALARSWYQKAKEWGSPEAQTRLDAIASFGR